MRLYQKKIFRNAARAEVESSTETRDAILWDVLPAQNVARVKIQGSNELIIAYYPQNWEKTPLWMKPGNAVRITHPKGLRNRVELVGHGSFIPTPVAGGGVTPAALTDAIITGCKVLAVIPNMMAVVITEGTFRLGGTLYYLTASGHTGAIPMGSMMPMGIGIPMGTIGGSAVQIDAAPATPGNYRYDLLVVGSDCLVDYVKGIESSNPVVPSVPANHLECGRILLFYGMTAITQTWINYPWVAPTPYSIYITPASTELTWVTLTTDVQVGVKDQYGNALSGSYYMTVAFDQGNGNFGGVNAPGVYSNSFTGDHFHATYTRPQLATDKSPVLRATLAGDIPLESTTFISLLDSAGKPMIG